MSRSGLALFLWCASCAADHEGDQPGECTDGADNDADGFFDCDDQDCFGADTCATTPSPETGAPDTSTGGEDTDTDTPTDTGTPPPPEPQAPEASIQSPLPLTVAWVGSPLALAATVGDLQQPPDTLTAQWRVVDDATGALVAFLDAHADAAGLIDDEWVAMARGALRVQLIVFDADANEALAEVPIIVEADVDGDGFAEGPDDCDDQDAAVHVGADEVCDGVDQDCDHEVDDKDLDGDGHVDWFCSGYTGLAPRDDCGDADPLVLPGAPEHCDGVDEDCDVTVDEFPVDGVTVYLDTDGDGWGEGKPYTVCAIGAGQTEAGGDCAAFDPAVHPGAVEICGSGVDEDCDGLAGPCSFTGTLTSADFGVTLDGPSVFTDVDAGDFDGDGIREVVAASGLAVSNNGRVHVLEAPAGALDLAVSSLDLELTGRWVDEGFGDAVSVADVDRDGDDDLLVGGTFAGVGGSYLGGAYLFRGPLVTGTYSDGASLQIYGAAGFDQLGHDLVFIADQTGDGLPDLLIGAKGADPNGVAGAGEASVFDGTSSGALTPTDAVSRLQASTSATAAGTRVLDAGDVDGDGQADLLIGAEGLQVDGLYLGGAYLVSGPAPATLDLDAAADARIEGTELSYAGRSLAAADLDGDGYSDLVLGAPNHGDLAVPLEGFACVLNGPVVGDVALASGALCVYGESSLQHAGGAVALGDLDQDGQRDLVVDFEYGAELRAFDAATAGTFGPADAFLTVEADANGDRLFAHFSDMNGDGTADLIVGAGASVWVGLTSEL